MDTLAQRTPAALAAATRVPRRCPSHQSTRTSEAVLGAMTTGPQTERFWPRLSDAAALLPVVRRALMDDPGAPRERGPDIDVFPIVEEGLFGYELTPRAPDQPVVSVGCHDDGIARVRRTEFDPHEAGLRLATLHGHLVDAHSAPVRRNPRQQETLFADWPTAASDVWAAFAGAPQGEPTRWLQAMDECRSLENALTIASLHLAEWDPVVEFFGVPNQAEYGLPLRGGGGDAGNLTLHRPDLWLLYWRSAQRIVQREWSRFSVPEDVPALLPRDAKR